MTSPKETLEIVSIQLQYVSFKEKDEKYVLAKIDKNAPHYIYSSIVDVLEEFGKSSSKGWAIKRRQVSEVVEQIEAAVKDSAKEPEKEEESSSSESESDGETIQRVLGKRLTVASAQKVIEYENISDSEMEDVVSLARRTRGLYKKIKKLEEQNRV